MRNHVNVSREVDSITELPWDYYEASKSSDIPFVIINGMGVAPPAKINDRISPEEFTKISYNGIFPHLLRKISGEEVGVFYQAGACNSKYMKDYYGKDTDMIPFEAAQSFLKGRRCYPITHSLSTILGMQLALRNDGKVLQGAISGAFDTAKDCLADENGNPRRLLGVSYYTLFEIAKYLPKSLPLKSIYPLYSQKAHDGYSDVEKVKAWGARRFSRVASAKDILGYDMTNYILGSKIPDKKPLFVITNQDKITSPERQRELARIFEAEKIEVNAGHRWFTEADSILIKIIERIIEHRNSLI